MHRKRLKDTLKPPISHIHQSENTTHLNTPHQPTHTDGERHECNKKGYDERRGKEGSVGGRGALEMGLEDSDNDQVFMDEVA